MSCPSHACQKWPCPRDNRVAPYCGITWGQFNTKYQSIWRVKIDNWSIVCLQSVSLVLQQRNPWQCPILISKDYHFPPLWLRLLWKLGLALFFMSCTDKITHLLAETPSAQGGRVLTLALIRSWRCCNRVDLQQSWQIIYGNPNRQYVMEKQGICHQPAQCTATAVSPGMVCTL